MKFIRIVPRNMVREVPRADAERLLASGSWCQAIVRGRRKPSARAQHRYRAHRREARFKSLYTWLPEAVHDLLRDIRLPGETQAAVIARLLRRAGNEHARGEKSADSGTPES